jgi:hypothetical protein
MGVNRIEGAVWYNEIAKHSATIIGLGATGSYLSFLLARAGLKTFKLVDFDAYETHNLASQLADFKSLGLNKAEANATILKNFTSATNIYTYNERVQDTPVVLYENYGASLIFSTLDSMEGRKFIFDEFSKRTGKGLLLDSRIGAEYYEVYCIPSNKKDYKEKYSETLFGDEQGNTGACNYQQSSHCATMAAAEMVKLVTNYLTNELMEDDDIPFKITHDLRTNNYAVYY